MTDNRQRDLKISDMTGTQSLGNTDLITLVQGGENKKINAADFIAGLSIEGQLLQAGSATATPVLDPQGVQNNIRNLEDGSGIKTSVSAENGITLEHDFLVNTQGSPVVENLSQKQPTFRSIVAGDGIAVGGGGGVIQISTSVTPVSTKTIVVNQVTDLPTAVGDVITLGADTVYLFTNDVDLGANRLVMAENTVIQGSSGQVITITSTASGNFITAADVSFRVQSITLNVSSADVFSISDTAGTKGIGIEDVQVVACNSLGTISGIAFGRIIDLVATCTTTGLTFSGTVGPVAIIRPVFFNNAGVCVNFGTAVMGAVTINDGLFQLNGAGTSVFSGLADSGNIAPAGIGVITNNRITITSGGTPLNGINVRDADWEFILNDDIANSRTDALISVQGNATETPIAVTSTAVKVAATWTVDPADQSRMSADTTGRITFDKTKPERLPIQCSMTVDPAGGGTKDISAYIAINGSIIANSRRQFQAASTVGTADVIWQYNFQPADYVEVFIANDTDTTNLIMTSAVFRID